MKLESRIREDLKRIGADKEDYKLDLRGYSKTYDGRYDPNTKTIVIYAREREGMLRDYKEIFEIALHEYIHHLQWEHDPEFVRYRGIMHNEDFYIALNNYSRRWVELNEKDMEKASRYDRFNIRANKSLYTKSLVKDSRIWI